MLDQLRHKRDVITLESNSGAVALEHAVGRLPDFFMTVKATFANLLSNPFKAFAARANISKIARRVVNRNYATMRTLEVTTPPGLKTDYLTYAHKLEDAAKTVLNLKAQVLQPFASWLGARLGNPSSLASLTTNLGITGYDPLGVAKFEKAIQSCFENHGRLETIAAYGDVIKRNADWTELAKVVENLGTIFSEAHHKEIVALVNQCTQMMDTLHLRMEEEPEIYRISPAALQTLSATCYDIGQELEFYGLLRHRINEFDHAVQQTADKLDQLQ